MERHIGMRASLTALFLLVAPTLLLPGVSRAEERAEDILPYLQAGPVIVRPSLALSETYRDNVYFVPEGATSDAVTSIVPGVTLILPFRVHELSLGASADFRVYAENSDLDTSAYKIFGRGDFRIGDRVKLKLGDTYRRDEESPLESPNATSDMYTDNAAALSVTYAFVDVAQVQADYTRTTLTFPDSSYRTRDEDLVSIFLYYRVLPATSAFLEYDFKNVGYDKTDSHDNSVHSGLFGATWDITENSKGTAKAGFLAKNFSAAALEDYTTWTASVDLQHRLTDITSVRLLGKRDVNEGKQPDVRYYTTTGIFVDFTYRFLDRLTGTLEGSYSQDSFSDPQAGQTEAREDKTARVGIGANYSFNSWLDFSLGYSYLDRDSNFESLSATVNSVTFAVTAHR